MTHTEAVNTLASERYLLDEMTESERNAFEDHYFSCLDCAEDIRMRRPDARRRRVWLRGRADRPGRHVRPGAKTCGARGSPGIETAALPWAVAATLAIAVAYQARPRQAVNPGATPPAGAHADHLASGEPWCGTGRFAWRRARRTRARCRYPCRRDRAGLRASRRRGPGGIRGRARSLPAQGSPLLLVIPAFTLKPEQQYHLRYATAPPRTGCSANTTSRRHH